VDILQTRLARLLAEYASAQQKLKQRLSKVSLPQTVQSGFIRSPEIKVIVYVTEYK
jgi:hypothetical protein